MVPTYVECTSCFRDEIWEIEWGQFIVVSTDRFEQFKFDLIKNGDLLIFHSKQVMWQK